MSAVKEALDALAEAAGQDPDKVRVVRAYVEAGEIQFMTRSGVVRVPIPIPTPVKDEDEEDLIGGTAFDVVGATEAEVKEWAESADDEAKAAALASEQGREKPRKGVVALLGKKD